MPGHRDTYHAEQPDRPIWGFKRMQTGWLSVWKSSGEQSVAGDHEINITRTRVWELLPKPRNLVPPIHRAQNRAVCLVFGAGRLRGCGNLFPIMESGPSCTCDVI